MKHALVKESEYGVSGIKAPLNEAGHKAEEVWGPALGGHEREESLRAVLTTVEKHRGVFEVSPVIADCIKRRDYEGLVEEFTRARKYVDDVKSMTRQVTDIGRPLSDVQIQQIIVTGRMWLDVTSQIKVFERDVWRQLGSPKLNNPSKTGASVGQSGSSSQFEEYLELISILLELGVDENPIWLWLLSRYDHLKSKISTSTERARVELEVLRRRLANSTPPSTHTTAYHLRSCGRRSASERSGAMDTPEVIELWERIFSTLNGILSPQGGILAEVIEFWDTAQSFIDGKTQRTLPIGIDGKSRVHHHLTQKEIGQLENGAKDLVNSIRDDIFAFFVDQPIEDISSLFSPISATPITPRTPMSASMLNDPRFQFDSNNLPPPSPKKGEPWEKFAFWPPYSNSISGVHYLGKLLVLVGTAASEMGALAPIGQAASTLDNLRILVGGTRERCVQAIAASWSKDAENCKYLEDWTRSQDKKDLTNTPFHFAAFEGAVISGMQNILFISEAKIKSGHADVVLPPPTKLLQLVRSQFVTSMYKALSGMVENAEISVKKGDDDWSDELVGPATTSDAANLTAYPVNAGDRNVRMLLTLSNLSALKIDIVPQLIVQFENAFSVKLADESKQIKEVMTQIDGRLFQSFTKPYKDNLTRIVRNGVSSPQWPPTGSRPTEARPYIYQALLGLVLVHTQVSTTASSLTNQVIAFLLEAITKDLLEAFKQRQRYPLAQLMQATLDAEFVNQTMMVYKTKACEEYLTAIYTVLDAGTDDRAREQLQEELPHLRGMLKGFRDQSRSEL
jgi:exocyst complex component 2